MLFERYWGFFILIETRKDELGKVTSILLTLWEKNVS